MREAALVEPRFLDEIRTRLSLAGVVGRRVKLQKKGRDYVGLCPFHKEKTPSFNVVEDKRFYTCFGCGAHGDVIKFVMQTESLGFRETVVSLAREAGLALPEALAHVAAPQREAPPTPIAPPVEERPRSESDEEKIEKAWKVWEGGAELRPGTPAWSYLVKDRCIDIAWPATVRAHPALELWETPQDAPNGKPLLVGRFPAVLAMVEDVEGNFVGVWRIYVNPERRGKALAKKGLGVARGGAVRLGPPGEDLGIGEGLESTASVIALGSVMPMWAALSTSGLRSLVLPDCVKRPVIFADNDRWKRRQDGAGIVRPGWDAAQAASERWKAEGRLPSIELPLLADFNDVLKARIGRALEVA